MTIHSPYRPVRPFGPSGERVVRLDPSVRPFDPKAGFGSQPAFEPGFRPRRSPEPAEKPLRSPEESPPEKPVERPVDRSPRSAAAAAPRAGPAPATLATGALFLAVFLFFWISVSPFVDRTNPTALVPTDAAGLLNQVAALLLAGASGAALAIGPWRQCRCLATLLFLAPLAWIVLTVVGSVEPPLSARRFVLTLLIVLQVVAVITLPSDRRHFAMFLALGMLLVLLICYGGVVLKPGLAIHTGDDVTEPMHAGHWRGPYIHKNAAGGAMALGIIVSIYVGRALSRVAGTLLGLACALFLVQTVAKTSLALLPLSLLMAEIVLRLPWKGLRYALVLGTLCLFGLFTLGSVVVAPVHDLLAAVSSDPTYTNRTEIWAYALSRLGERPLIGQGFEAFWRSGSVYYGAADTFANSAANGHDGYLDVLLTTGVPGLLLCLGAFVIQPMLDLQKSLETGNDPVTTAFFARLWVFGLLYSFLESIFFNNTPGWFMFLMSILGLRFLASARVVESRPPPGAAQSPPQSGSIPVEAVAETSPETRLSSGWR